MFVLRRSDSKVCMPTLFGLTFNQTGKKKIHIKIEDIEPTLGVSLRHIYHLAADEYLSAYKHVVKVKGSPHPKQYQQEDALECSADPDEDRRWLPSDMHDLLSMFQQARNDNGSGPPELGTLAQAQASGLALSRALKLTGHPGYSVY